LRVAVTAQSYHEGKALAAFCAGRRTTAIVASHEGSQAATSERISSDALRCCVRFGVAAVPEKRPWYWEGRVQDALAWHLAAEGWIVRETADTESKAQGIDLLAEMRGRWLAVEVKGFPNTTYDHGPNRGMPKPTQPTNQARQWFSHALLGMMLLRHRRADAEIAICLPRFKTYESLVDRTRHSFERLGFGAYFVRETGSVELVLPHVAVDRHRDSEARVLVGAARAGLDHAGAMSAEATCRAEILAAFRRLERRHGRSVFAPAEVVQEVLAVTDRYPAPTIRTEIVSRMCSGAPVHHAVAYDDLERVARGQYRVRANSRR
jgi:hypothetical protein